MMAIECAEHTPQGFVGASEQCWAVVLVSGLCVCSMFLPHFRFSRVRALLEHLVCQHEEPRWDREAQGSGRLEVNGQRVFHRLLDRHVGRLRAVQNLVDDDGDMTERLAGVLRIRQQSPRSDKPWPHVDRWEAALGDKVDNLEAMRDEQGVRSNEQRVRRLAGNSGERLLQVLGDMPHLPDVELEAEGRRGRLDYTSMEMLGVTPPSGAPQPLCLGPDTSV
jgi:hypothetical protein